MPLLGLQVEGDISNEVRHVLGATVHVSVGRPAYAAREWFDLHPHPMWVYDVDTLRVLDVNRAALVQFGHTREQFLALVHPNLESERAPSDDFPSRPGLVPSVPRQFRRADGVLIDACVISYPIRSSGKNARIVELQDVTARLAYDRRVSQLHVDLVETNTRLADLNAKLAQANHHLEQANLRFAQANRELEAANRTKEEFLGTLSHELRTPLNAVVLWTRLLRNRPLSDSDLTEITDMIDANVRVQKRLIEDLLDLSALLAGRLKLRPIPTDVRMVVEDAVDIVRPHADEADVRLSIAPIPGSAKVVGDPVRLRQALVHVLENAVKFSPRDSTVDVRLTDTDGRVLLSVIDRGNGISNEFLPHVFEPFRQADASTHRRHDGLGLGLSIVRGVVELHGGTVDVLSQGPGFGATVTIDLPSLRPIPAPPNS